MADFLKFVEGLPKCENAADGEGMDATANTVEADATDDEGVSTRENAAESAGTDAAANAVEADAAESAEAETETETTTGRDA